MEMSYKSIYIHARGSVILKTYKRNSEIEWKNKQKTKKPHTIHIFENLSCQIGLSAVCVNITKVYLMIQI